MNSKELSTEAPNSRPQVSLLIPARRSNHSLQTAVTEAHAFLSKRYPDSFEILLVPNPAPGDREDQTEAIAEILCSRYPGVRSVTHRKAPGKGAALQTGFAAARGRWIFFTDADLPYDLEFFDRAAAALRAGYELVTGNRRLLSSHFNVPVSLLPLAYGRHRLGLWFNRVVRLLLPIETTDTQAGIKAMSREFAEAAFSRQSCPGFFFDLELFLTAAREGYASLELPVTLFLNTEKSTVRVLRESVLAAYWLVRITLQNKRGHYGRRTRRLKILPRYRQLSLGTRLFLLARWYLTPYSRMASRLPAQGRVLDLGCGHGLFALAAALQFPRRSVLALDHDEERVQLATRATLDLKNIRFEKGSMLGAVAPEPYSAIAMIDVMHYFEPGLQEDLARQAFRLLEKGGTLLVREVNPEGGLISSWNRLYEKLATATGFTQAAKPGLHFRSIQGWTELLRKAGFQVGFEKCSSPLFADILYVCHRL